MSLPYTYLPPEPASGSAPDSALDSHSASLHQHHSTAWLGWGNGVILGGVTFFALLGASLGGWWWFTQRQSRVAEVSLGQNPPSDGRTQTPGPNQPDVPLDEPLEAFPLPLAPSLAAFSAGTVLPVRTPPPQETQTQEAQESLVTAGLSLEKFVQGCEANCDRVLRSPNFVSLADATWLTPSEIVFVWQELLPDGREVTRLYPRSALAWHSGIEDQTESGLPLFITYSPYSDAGRAFLRQTSSGVLPFLRSSWFLEGSVVFQDGWEGSLWSGLSGKALSGPAAERGEAVPALPLGRVSWLEARDLYPSAQILQPETTSQQHYSSSETANFLTNETLLFSRKFPADFSATVPAKTPVVGFVFTSGITVAIPESKLLSVQSQVFQVLVPSGSRDPQLPTAVTSENLDTTALDQNSPSSQPQRFQSGSRPGFFFLKNLDTNEVAFGTISLWFSWLEAYPHTTLVLDSAITR